jgi:hypothetical protein
MEFKSSGRLLGVTVNFIKSSGSQCLFLFSFFLSKLNVDFLFFFEVGFFFPTPTPSHAWIFSFLTDFCAI